MSAELLPEYRLLRTALGSRTLAQQMARAPGGWRTLSRTELESMGVDRVDRRRVLALQKLLRLGYPELPRHQFVSAAEVGRVYGERLGGHVHEVILAAALDGRSNFLGEVVLAKGGAHGACVRPADVLRPIIRIGASAFVLVHNHPSGDPTPSQEDIDLTQALTNIGELVGVPLVDHVIIGARGGGYASLFDIGLVPPSTGGSS